MYGFTQGYCAMLSMVSATGIAGERALLLRFPRLYARLHRQPTYAKVSQRSPSSLLPVRLGLEVSSAVVLAYTLALMGPPLVGWNGYRLEGHLTSCSFDFASKESPSSSPDECPRALDVRIGSWIDRSYLVAVCVFGFILPASCIAYSSWLILYSLR